MAGAAVPIGAIASIGGLNQFIAGLTAVGNQFQQVSQQSKAVAPGLEAATAGFAEFSKQTAAVAKSVDVVANAFGTLLSPITAAGSAISGAVSGLADIAEEGSSRTVTALAGIGVAAGALGVGGAVGVTTFGAALAAAFGASVATAARFQREVVDLAAITQEAPSSIGAMTDEVKNLARQFATSIPDIQAAGLELTRAGIPMDIVTGGALKLTLALEQLSKGEITAGAAAEGLGSILTVFHSSLSEANEVTVEGATRVANAVTGIANATRASIPEVFTAFAKFGPVVADAGESVETAAAAVGLLLKAGLRGEEAGTALRNFFVRLQNPASESRAIMQEFGISLSDAEGNTRAYASVLTDLIETFSPAARATNGISEATANWALAEIFQTRALTATKLALSQGTAEYNAFLEVIRQTSILEQAAAQMDAVFRQLARFRNVVDLAAISFGENFVGGLSAATRSMSDFLVEGQKLERLAGALGSGIQGIVTGTGAQAGSPAQAAVSEQFGEDAARSLALVTAETQRVVASIGETLAAAGRLKDVFVGIVFPDGVDDLIGRVGEVLVQANLAAQGFLEFIGRIAPATADAFGTAVRGVLDFIGGLKDIATAGLTVDDVVDAFSDVERFARSVASVIGSAATAAVGFARAIFDNRDQILGTLTLVISAFGKIIEIVFNVASAVVNLTGAILRLQGAINNLPNVIAGGALEKAFGFAESRGLVPEGSTQQLFGGGGGEDPRIQALRDFQQELESSQAQAQDFFRTIQGGDSILDGLFESFLTGESTVQRQIKALEELQGVVSRGSTVELGTFLGDSKIPQEIKDAIAEIQEITQQFSTIPLDQTNAALDRMNELWRFIAASAGVARENLTAANLASSLGTGAGSTGPAGSSDPNAIRREVEQAERSLAQARSRIAEAGEDAAKNLRTAEERLSRSMASILQRQADALASNIRQLIDAEDNAREQFDEARDRLIRDAALSRSRTEQDIGRSRADESARIVFDQGIENERIARQQQAEDREQIAARTATRLEDIERRNQDNVTRIRQQGIDNANTVFQRGQEDALRILTQANEQATQALTRQFDATNTARGRGREDTRRQRDLARELAKATTEEERKGIQERFAEQTQTLTERRKEEDEENQIRRAQEEQLQALRKAQEGAVIQFRRGQEDIATNRRREQEVADINFRISLEQQFQRFREDLEDQARGRARTAQAAELGATRGDQARGREFGQDQQDALRAEVTIPREDQDLETRIAEALRDRDRRINQARETSARQQASSIETAARELDSAFATFLESQRSQQARIDDLQSDLFRGNQERQAELLALRATAPPDQQAKIDEALAQLRTLGSAYQGLRANQDAAGAAATGFARAEVQATKDRIGAVEQEQQTLEELQERLRELREAPIGPGGDGAFGAGGSAKFEIRALVVSPQADQIVTLLRAIERNTAAPGSSAPLIGEINLAPTEQAARDVGTAVEQAVQFVGGNA